jgi:hypothetical protein
MTFSSAGSYGWIIRARAFVLGAGRRPSGDTRREEDAECQFQTAGLVR